MSRKLFSTFVVPFLIIGLFLVACSGATTAPPEESAIPMDTPAPPEPIQPPSPTLPPPTDIPTEEPPELNPSSRGFVSMAYDSESKQVILFGGSTGDETDPANYSDETWAFDIMAQTWTEMKPPEAPSPRGSPAMAYDSESDRIILFGGTRTRNSTSRDTWAYDYNTNTWTKMKAQGPAKSLGPAMAYDAESDRVILFGGFDFDSYKMYQDTWVYDFNTDSWAEMKPEASPPGQAFHAMTYDTDSDRILLFGGHTKTPDPSNVVPLDGSVWAYDFNTNAWEKKSTSSGPAPRLNHAFVYDVNADRAFLYGGSNKPSWDSPSDTGETRSYNYKTNTWDSISETSPFPGSLSRFAMVYVPDIDRYIVFGGQVGGRQENYTNQTWVYDFTTNTWTDVTREP